MVIEKSRKALDVGEADGLLDGTAVAPAPIQPTIPIEIPTAPVSAREAWRQARHAERLARAIRMAQERGLDFDLPF